MKRLLLAAALAAALPSTASAYTLVVPRPDGTDGPACIHVVDHDVVMEVSPAGGRVTQTVRFAIDRPIRATILAPALHAGPGRLARSLEGAAGSTVRPVARLDGEALATSAMGGADALLALAAERQTPELAVLAGLPMWAVEVDLAAGEHVLESEHPPLASWSSDVPLIVEPLRHLGTACATPTIDVQVNLQTSERAATVFTPYHDREVSQLPDGGLGVRVRVPAGQQCHDLHMYVISSDQPVAASALTYREPSCDPSEDGAFGYAVVGAGPTVTERRAAVAKDLVLVIDTSGSMGGEKIEQVRRALASILDNLGPEDRFDLIAFAGEIRPLFGALVPASDASRLERARAVARELAADGSTNINDALLAGLSELGREDGERPRMIMFLTDGAATTGVTDVRQILANVKAANEIGARIHGFGVGYDVNTLLIDELARESGGVASYIRPGDDVARVLEAFYGKIQAPIATDLDLTAEGITVSDLNPDKLPDLFVGSDLFALARYHDGAAARLSLGARTESGPARFPVRGAILRDGTEHSFLPRLWASRRLGQLLYEARQNGGATGTVAEIRALALRHGFVTPFTPFSLDENGDVRREYENPTGDMTGSEAVGTSTYINDLSGNSNAAAYGAGEGVAPMRQVLDRTFVLEKGYWVDTRVAADLAGVDAVEVAFGGEEWRRLLSAGPELRAFLSVGRSVVFEWRCAIVRVTDRDAHEEPPAEERVPEALVAAAPGAARIPAVDGPLPEPPAGPAPGAGAAGGGELQEAEASCSAMSGGGEPWLAIAIALLAARVSRRRRRGA